ncbi:hypothetical protein SF83666_b51770 (plasmid) [Sinorhizobium fredii CCBAU 83666]|nr:hypothetical protein SF83666_b51770 [Sinorhizobium fredii CCBAU 83666]
MGKPSIAEITHPFQRCLLFGAFGAQSPDRSQEITDSLPAAGPILGTLLILH